MAALARSQHRRMGQDMRTMIVAVLLLAGGCSDLPWDAEGTLERVKATKVLRAGIVSTGSEANDALPKSFLARIATETGSVPALVTGSTEVLLPRIEAGELDIVVGHFAADTPWARRVTIMPTPRQMGVKDGSVAPAAVVRNGENGWVALVYRHAEMLQGTSLKKGKQTEHGR